MKGLTSTARRYFLFLFFSFLQNRVQLSDLALRLGRLYFSRTVCSSANRAVFQSGSSMTPSGTTISPSIGFHMRNLPMPVACQRIFFSHGTNLSIYTPFAVRNKPEPVLRYPSIKAGSSTYLYENSGHLKIKLSPK